MDLTGLKLHPPNGISIIIAGAGVGGLMTALECYRKGCSVRIFDQSATTVTTGDSFAIGPTAINAFKHWPAIQAENEAIAYDPLHAYHSHTGVRLTDPMPSQTMFSARITREQMPTRIYRHSRPKFHAMLLAQLARLGMRVEYGREVVAYAEDEDAGTASVLLKDGSSHEADLVVAADGVRSASGQLVAGKPMPARSSGHATFRVAYPVDVALADPLIRDRFKLLEDGRSVVEIWTGQGMFAIFWRNQDEMQWSINHNEQDTAKESWSHYASTDEVLRLTATVPGWPEVANRVIQATPPRLLVNWKLMCRDPQPRWTSPGGRVVQLGDTAHTFLPTSGNGGTQAIEDAVSLATCLEIAGRENVAWATRVHNLLRFERVSCMQAFGIVNMAKLKSSNSGKKDTQGPKLQFGKWIVEHDPEQYVYECYEKALRHLREGTPFQNTNTPPGLVYRPWTVDGLLEARERGEQTILDGDWS